MPGNVSRGVDRILTTVRSFGKKSGSYESLAAESLADGEGIFSAKQQAMRPSHRGGGRSKICVLPDDIPQGYLAVYVGAERRRFVISTAYLSHQLFKALLKRSEEEFGFQSRGGLEIACEPVLFEHLLWLIGTNSPAATSAQLDQLLGFSAHYD